MIKMAVYKDKAVKKNPWYFIIEAGSSGGQGRIKRRGFRIKKEAEEAERELLNEIKNGLDLSGAKMKVSELLRSWLRGKQKISKETKDVYNWLIEDHLIPEFEGETVQSLSPKKIEGVYLGWRENEDDSLCGDNQKKCHTILKAALKKAVGWGAIIKNPAEFVEPPVSEPKEMKYWSSENAHRFLKAAEDDRYYTVFLMAITLGMRQGEILGADETELNLSTKSLGIIRTLDHKGSTLQLKTKTKSSRRSIGIDKVTLSQLEKVVRRNKREKLKAGGVYEEHNLLIRTQNGTPVSPRNINRTFSRIIKQINNDAKVGEELEKIRFHDLRHTHVVMLLEMRENNKRIAERLGWSSVKMLDRYAHISPHMQQDTADAFGEMFYNKNQVAQ
jgi:integrase